MRLDITGRNEMPQSNRTVAKTHISRMLMPISFFQELSHPLSQLHSWEQRHRRFLVDPVLVQLEVIVDALDNRMRHRFHVPSQRGQQPGYEKFEKVADRERWRRGIVEVRPATELCPQSFVACLYVSEMFLYFCRSIESLRDVQSLHNLSVYSDMLIRTSSMRALIASFSNNCSRTCSP